MFNTKPTDTPLDHIISHDDFILLEATKRTIKERERTNRIYAVRHLLVEKWDSDANWAKLSDDTLERIKKEVGKK